MKTKLSSFFSILLVILLSFSSLTILSVNAQVMSFAEAIEHLTDREYYEWNRTKTTTQKPIYTHYSEQQEISGSLIWIAQNGTYYQAEYPSLIIREELGIFSNSEIYNNPKGYFIWILEPDIYGVPPSYWMLAHNGTIVYDTPPNLGPTPPPEIEIQDIIYGLMMFGGIILVGLGILAYYKKFKRKS